jgi:hypothetical protein
LHVWLPLARRLRALAVGAGYHSRPRFLIVGAQKAGTTALFYYLAEHPDLVPAYEKEVGFFAPEPFRDWPEHPLHDVLWRDGRAAFDDPRTYAAALAWYHGNFPLPHRLGRHRLTFEATAEYLYYPLVPERIRRYDPDMKLIALLRDPVDRAFSAWNMYRRFGGYRPLIYAPKRETRDFPTAIDEELRQLEAGQRIGGSSDLEPGYVRRGLYHDQLARYLGSFPREHILVLESRDLMNRTGEVIDRVAEFLGLRPMDRDIDWEPMHVGSYEGRIPSPTAARLKAFFRPHNQQLFELLGRDLDW